MNVNPETGKTNATDAERSVILKKTVLFPEPLPEIDQETEEDTPQAQDLLPDLPLVQDPDQDLTLDPEGEEEDPATINPEEEKDPILPVDQDLVPDLLDLHLLDLLHLEEEITEINPEKENNPKKKEEDLTQTAERITDLNPNPDLNQNQNLKNLLKDLNPVPKILDTDHYHRPS